MRRSLSLALTTTVALAAAAVAAPAGAVKHGSADDGRHPIVGVMVAQDELGNPMWDCSGTLLSPTVFVTAGHCTSTDTYDANGELVSVEHVEVWFDDGPIDVDPRFISDPDDRWCEGGGVRYDFPCGGDARGTASTHPDYDPASFTEHDLGVVVLDAAPDGLPDGVDFPTLPDPGAYEDWRPNQKQIFTSVGYGVQLDYGHGAAWKEVANVTERRVAQPRLVSINTPSVGEHAMVLSNNARTGGTCRGDSGGPNFLAGTLELAAVTSYGKKAQTCSGPTGAYRLDGEDDLAWLTGFLD